MLAHSNTWSARWSSAGGTVRPSALAVLRLITSSNLVACSTGRSAGRASLRTFVHVDGEAAEDVASVPSVGHQPARLGELPIPGDARQLVRRREIRNEASVRIVPARLGHDDRV